MTKLLKINPGERRLLAWVTLLQVIMSSSGIIVNNVAQTTFLKRYGAESLPVVFMAEAGITFLCTMLIGALMERFRKIRVFTGMLVFYGMAMVLVRISIGLDASLSYPALYILKSQAVGILPILYWDILNDMFTTQQSKRLYSLISAGGVLGIMIGSLSTHPLAARLGMENILLIFTCGMFITAVLNEMTERITAVPLQARATRQTKKTGQAVKALGRDFFNQYRSSPLLKYMILLLAIPNIMLPVMDFQFNVLVDRHFVTEARTLEFFAMFRGGSNALMFVLLLVSGRVISKWGIPISLIFHPVNYCLAFAGTLFRFDIIAGVYARLSTEVLKTVLNNPARAVLYNFFPEQHRSMIRLVLRGGIVRISDFTGSGILILLSGLVDPRMLSLAVLPLGAAWVMTALRLKRAYPDILIQTLKTGQVDWDLIEENTLKLLAGDRRALQSLAAGLSSPSHDTAILSAELLSAASPDVFVRNMLSLVGRKPPVVQEKWLSLIPRETAALHLPALYRAAASADTQILRSWLAFLNRVDAGNNPSFMEAYLNHPAPGVRSEALIGACVGCSIAHRDRYKRQMDAWLGGGRDHQLMAMNVLRKTGDPGYASAVEKIYKTSPVPETTSAALLALAAIAPEIGAQHALAESGNISPIIRGSVLEVLAASRSEIPTQTLVSFLGDPDPGIRSRAVHLLSSKGGVLIPALLGALAGHSRILQEAAVQLLERIGAPQADLSRFVMERLKAACHDLAGVHYLAEMRESTAAGLLRRFLEERHSGTVNLVLRMLGTAEFRDKMPVIIKAVQSGQRKDIDNAIEALESALHKRLRHALIPHLENRPVSDRIADSARALYISPPSFTSMPQLADYLVTKGCSPWIVQLNLYVLFEAGESEAAQGLIRRLHHEFSAELSSGLFKLGGATADEALAEEYRKRLSGTMESAVRLKTSLLFKKMETCDLLSLAENSRLKTVEKGEIILQGAEKSPGLYLLCDGQFAVKGSRAPETLSADLNKYGFAGEMGWVDQRPELFSVVAETHGQVLYIPGSLFGSILKNSPETVLALCRFYTDRIRAYHEVLRKHEIAFNAAP